MTQATEQLDAEVLRLCRELIAHRSYVRATLLQRRLPDDVSPARLLSSLDRLEGAGLLARRRIADGRRTKNREYVVTSKGRGE